MRPIASRSEAAEEAQPSSDAAGAYTAYVDRRWAVLRRVTFGASSNPILADADPFCGRWRPLMPPKEVPEEHLCFASVDNAEAVPAGAAGPP